MQACGTDGTAKSQHTQPKSQAPNSTELRNTNGPSERDQQQAEDEQYERTDHKPQTQAVTGLARRAPYQAGEIQPAKDPEKGREQNCTNGFVALPGPNIHKARQSQCR